MAHKIGELDSPMYGSLKPAWHGLGTVVAGQPNSAEALKIAKMDWTVAKEPVYINADGQTVEIPGYKAVVRSDLTPTDARRALGVVSDDYKPIDNQQWFRIADDLAGEGGASFETAGTLMNGRIVWLLAKMPKTSHVFDDTLERYMLITSGHDGRHRGRILFTPTRVVCWNTLSFALKDAKDETSADVLHRGDVDTQIKDAKRILGLADSYFDEHQTIMQQLAGMKIDDRFALAWLLSLWPDPEEGATRCRNGDVRKRILKLYRGEQNGGDQEAVKGTAYGLLNAATQWIDHEKLFIGRNGTTRQEARMRSVMFDSAHQLKQNAFGLMARALGIEARTSPAIEELAAAMQVN